MNASSIFTFLSSRSASVIVVACAIAARAVQLLFYVDSFFDTTFQVIATQNFLAGHGITTAVVNPEDLSSAVYQPLINWPPGYSLLLSPLYIASGENYLIACLILDVLAATAIILLTRKILKLLSVSLALINLFTLLTAFFIYYFYYTGSTDGISIAFFLGAITASLALIKTNKRWGQRSVVTGVCLLFSASLKYLFFPVVFVLPVFLLVYGFQNKLKHIKQAAWTSLGIVAIGLTLLYLYQKSISGTGTYISSPGRGFFPEHLLRLHPAIPCAFVTPNTVKKLPAGIAEPAMNTLRILHVIISCVVTLFAVFHFFKSGLKQASLQKIFFYLAFCLSATISLVLISLSLLVDKEIILPDRWWTYVEDARYYGLSDILLHLSIISLFYHYRNRITGYKKIVLIILPLMLIPEAIRGFTFTAKRVINSGREEYYWQSEKDFFNTGARAIKQMQDSLHVQKAIVASSLYYGSYRASLLMQVPVLENTAVLNKPASLHSTEPVVVLFIIKHDRLLNFQPFISYPDTKLAGELNGFYFYTLYVQPGKQN